MTERLVTTDSPATEAHSARDLTLRVVRRLDRNGLCDRQDRVQIRLRFVRRNGDAVVDDVGHLTGVPDH
ncbi:hypothetical protein [uncultured Sphingomonas sp.]|uniref:hypothetical protein n=1 Tax=uncultured Sphingomonas sp. TaxID=158754 RepID=UPI0037499F11